MIMQSYFAQVSKYVIVTSEVLKDDVENLPVTHFERSHKIFKVTMKTLDQVYLGSLDVMPSTLWRNFSAKKRADKKEMKIIANLMSRQDHGNRKDKDKDRCNSGNGDNKPPKKPKPCLTSGRIMCKCSNLSLPPPCFNFQQRLQNL